MYDMYAHWYTQVDRNIAHLRANQDMSAVGAVTSAAGVSSLGANPGGAAGVVEGGRGVMSRASSNVSDVRPAIGAPSFLVRSLHVYVVKRRRQNMVWGSAFGLGH